MEKFRLNNNSCTVIKNLIDQVAGLDRAIQKTKSDLSTKVVLDYSPSVDQLVGAPFKVEVDKNLVLSSLEETRNEVLAALERAGVRIADQVKNLAPAFDEKDK